VLKYPKNGRQSLQNGFLPHKTS